MDLVYFGNNNLQVPGKVTVNSTDDPSGAPNEVQRSPLARGQGSIPTNVRITEKTITIEGDLYSDTNKTLVERLREFKTMLDVPDSYLRIMPESSFQVLHDPEAVGSWSGSDDAVSLSADTTDFQYGTTSLKFNIVVATSANDQATLTNSSLTSVNLSTHTSTGSFEFWVYIPDPLYITGINLRVGSDSSNYYSATITTDYQGKTFSTGWNLLSADWSAMTTTGSPNAAALTYLRIQIQYQSAQADMSGLRLDGFLWVNDDLVRNYPAYRIDASPQITRNNSDINRVQFSAQFLNYTGTSIGTHSVTGFNKTGVTALQDDETVDIDGSYKPLPQFTITVNTATGLDTISIVNILTGETLTYSGSWAAGDKIVVGGRSFISQLNGATKDFTGKIPSAALKRNRFRLQLATTSPTVTSFTTNTTQRKVSEGNYLAQSFVAGATGTITKIEILAYQTISAFYDFISIYADSAGSPGTRLGLATIVIPVGSTLAYIASTSPAAAVTNGTTYWIVFQNTIVYGAGSGSDVYWGYDGAGGYGSGAAKTSTNGTSWSAATGDQDFKVTISPAPAYNIDWSMVYNKQDL